MTLKPLTATVVRRDLPASFVVFLVTVPLSLGIAVASGAPVAAGLIAAIVGGIAAGALGGSPLQVSGPAAGLTLLVASLVQTYGWRATCTITLLAGLVQLLLGAGRVARAALAVSPAVVYGMLAGIGVVLILAQIHVVLGGSPQHSALHNVLELPGQLVGHHSHAVLIGLLTIAVLVSWGRLPLPWRGTAGAVARWVPAPLPAVVAATVTAWALGWDVPRVELPDGLFDDWQAPAMPSGSPLAITGAVVAVAVVAGVETLLCSLGVDRMRPPGTPRSDLDRELAGQGAANVLSGLLGGLPVAGVAVRSTANINAGARTRAATVMHGAWVLLLALLCGPVIELVPLSALAALLVAMGYKLIDIARVRDLRNHREAPVYFVTLGGVVLLGLGEGVLLGIVLTAWMALRRLTRLSVSVEEAAGRWHVAVTGSLTFLGVPQLMGVLRQVPAGASVDLDLNVDFMDHAAFEAVHDWRLSHERQGGEVDIDEIHECWYERAVTGETSPARKSPPPGRWWAPWANRWRRNNRSSPDASEMSPRSLLLAGVREYHGQMAPLVRPILAELAFQQTPEHLFITCVDSRVVPNIITASGPGDLFILRNVGNLVPRHGSRLADDSVMAAVEYATNVLRIKTITVCGHSNCGAMAGVLAGGTEVEHLPGLSRWLKHANHSLARFVEAEPNDGQSPLSRLCQINVQQQLDNLLTYPWLRRLVEAGELELVGLYLDLETAKVHILDRQASKFVPIPDDASGDVENLSTAT